MSQPFRDPLEHLHSRFDEVEEDSLDPDLQALQDDTRKVLERDDHREALSEDLGFRGRLEAAIERYGASHPDLTRAAQSVLDVLNANGL